jgi:signal transduction histidine kinase
MRASRRLRLQVGALFAVIIAAFLAVNALVMLAVWPRIRHLEATYGGLGEDLQLLAHMRGATQLLRSIATVSAYRASLGDRSAGEQAGHQLVEQVGWLERLAAEYSQRVQPGEQETWSTIRERALPPLVARAAGVVESVRLSGQASPVAVDDLVARSLHVDELFAQLGRNKAAEVQRVAAQIDGFLKRLLFACGALLVFGGAGAGLLLARSLGLIRAYATVMDTRLSELDAFAARVAHDLRSPLQTISLSLARVATTSDEEGRTAAERGQGGVRRMNAMIAGLLEFARSGATPEPGECAEVPTVFEGLRDELQPLADRAGVRLSLSAEPDLRAAASPVAVHAIVANLVGNAIKYMRGDGERNVTASARAQGNHVRIEVRDTGIGIPRDRLGTIFDPFVRLRERRDSYGLGLATVKRLVDAHRGTVRVESEQGVGSAFTVELPRTVDVPGL